MIQPNRIYTLRAASKILRVSPAVLAKEVRRHRLKATRVGVRYRITGNNLIEYLLPKRGITLIGDKKVLKEADVAIRELAQKYGIKLLAD